LLRAAERKPEKRKLLQQGKDRLAEAASHESMAAWLAFWGEVFPVFITL